MCGHIPLTALIEAHCPGRRQRLRGPSSVARFDGINPLLTKLTRLGGLLPSLRKAGIREAAESHLPFNPPRLAVGGGSNLARGKAEQPRSPHAFSVGPHCRLQIKPPAITVHTGRGRLHSSIR